MHPTLGKVKAVWAFLAAKVCRSLVAAVLSLFIRNGFNGEVFIQVSFISGNILCGSFVWTCYLFAEKGEKVTCSVHEAGAVG
jgi:hypothetical protein